ncbi:maleylacetoacetate isomerase-like [Clytia hemisphaerica]|uniref:maleylacetoacetate isomerase n=1 Tax=Clytia hemisphaerica TaxID=252671 RepID=A0A7M5V0C8_9CNID
MLLYSYFRSSCSWRVRIALALKNIKYEYKPINLLKSEQQSDEYKLINPSGSVPCLVTKGHTLTQSQAIMEYLDEVYPDGHALLPKDDPIKRATVRKLSNVIAADIQPVQNLRILKKVGSETKMEWGHWAIHCGFVVLEKMLAETAGKYCFGDEITMVDCCLAPQVYNANRFKVDMSEFPIISRVNEELMKHDAFLTSRPEAQSDCPEELRS